MNFDYPYNQNDFIQFKGYGKRFLDSLPKCKMVFDTERLGVEYGRITGS